MGVHSARHPAARHQLTLTHPPPLQSSDCSQRGTPSAGLLRIEPLQPKPLQPSSCNPSCCNPSCCNPSGLPTCANSSSFNRPNTSSAVQPLLRVGRAIQQQSELSHAQQATKWQLLQPAGAAGTCSTRCAGPEKQKNRSNCCTGCYGWPCFCTPSMTAYKRETGHVSAPTCSTRCTAPQSPRRSTASPGRHP